MLYVPQGNISQIITHLKDKKIDLTFIDKYIIRFIGYPQQGWIDIGASKLSHADFLYRLTKSKAALVEVTLIPGETTYLFLNELSSQLNLNRQNFKSILMNTLR